MNNSTYTLLLILIIAITTFLLRAIPFLVFNENRKIPHIITKLSSVLPFAVMGMLVIYCLKNLSIFTYPNGLPELISIVITTICHTLKRNTLLSILLGTLSYIVLIQFVF